MPESTLGNSLLGIVTGGSISAVVTANATLITIGLTVVGLIMAFGFHWVSMKQKDRLTEDWKNREREKIRQELLDAAGKDSSSKK